MTVDFVGKHLLKWLNSIVQHYAPICYFHSDCRLSRIGLEMKGCEEHCLSVLGCICL